MLKLLLNEHISPAVAAGLRRRHPQISIFCLADWEQGALLGQPDAACLLQSTTQHLTLVTYDRRTIPPLLKAWGEQGQDHGGVIFVDEKTIPPPDIGGLVRGLSELWRNSSRWDWTNRVYFLRR
jgi:hypothetical protein